MTENNSTIGYKFTPMPKKLMHVLDVNLRSMLFALIDASNKFADDENGWFYRTNDQLQQDSDLSKNLVNATVDTLFQHSLVEVSCIGMGKGRKEPNGYKLNVELFRLFEQLDMNDIHRPENRIKTVTYKGSGYHPSYLDDDPERLVPEVVKGRITWKSTKPPTEPVPDDTSSSTTESTNNVTKSEHNIDNIESLNNKDNKENIYNKEYVENVNNIHEYNDKFNNNINDNITGNNKKENKENINSNNDFNSSNLLNEDKDLKDFCESSTEPNSIPLNEGKENSDEYQDNYNSSYENQEPLPSEEPHEARSLAESPSSIQSHEEKQSQEQEGDSSPVKKRLSTEGEEYQDWKKFIDVRLEHLRNVSGLADYNQKKHYFLEGVTDRMMRKDFVSETVKKRIMSYIDDNLSSLEYVALCKGS